MPKKLSIKIAKPGSVRGSRSKRLGSVKSASLSRAKSGKRVVARKAATGKFVSAKTGRIVKSSPAQPNLSRERIRSAVTAYVNRDTRTGRFSD